MLVTRQSKDIINPRVTLAKGLLLKEKAKYTWPPCNNNLTTLDLGMMWRVFYHCAIHADQHLTVAFVVMIVLFKALVTFFANQG